MPIDHTIPFLNPFSEFILQDVVEGLGPTKAASHLTKLEAVGKKRLEHLEISFHKEFHPQHNWTLKKHHWRNFCIFIGLAQEPNPDCAPCARVFPLPVLPPVPCWENFLQLLHTIAFSTCRLLKTTFMYNECAAWNCC